MKILVVQDYLRSGGTERQSVFLANAFASKGHDTTLLSFRPGGRLDSTVGASVRRQVLQPFDLGADWFAPGLRAQVRSEEPHVVLCMGRMANCYAGMIQRGSPGRPVVATMRTGKSLPWLFRRSLRHVRHVVANSRDARDVLLAKYRISGDKVSVIHNSLVFPPAAPAVAESNARTSVRVQYGARPDTFVLLCVAMFRPEKSQRELVEVVAGLPMSSKVELWLAGDGPARAGCERLTRDRQAEERVRFVGFHRNPTPLYLAADAAVHASSSESLSNFLIEAQAHGLPAVVYAAQGMEECFVPGRTGWAVTWGDRDAFRRRVMELANASATDRAVRGAEARTFARTAFDSDTQVEAYLTLFRELISQREHEFTRP